MDPQPKLLGRYFKDPWEIVAIYLIISILWLIVTAIVAVGYKKSVLGIVIFIIWTLIYIPLAYYYISKGNYKRVEDLTIITILGLIIYLVIEAILALTFIVGLVA